ncbi:probable receptor-like protein kinase at5g61350 [Phtheirospermum japonicum]|uniref:Probable receptor-like protein kinase at5g61350 n=1 Tax=Phtheirospermum japonicum TaxID=374723 RepID=A0A830CKU9_9LAMI|nr:probable receptor-like protein kinase at5g61350 [Phtheirospermum japonicum]
MTRGTSRRLKPRSISPVLVFSYILVITKFINVVLCSSPTSSFTPADNYLINCGSLDNSVLDDGRTFKSDPQSASYLWTDEDILTSINSLPNNALSPPPFFLPLYGSARIFHRESMYRFLVYKPGLHFIRLHFYPLPHPSYNLTSATFTVATDDIVLLHGFSVKDRADKMVLKEYLINITSDKFTLKFSPMKKSIAFINAIELLSAPEDLISDSASAIFPAGEFNGLNKYSFQVLYRLNVGGPMVTPKNDTLWRTWFSDGRFMVLPEGATNVSVPADMIRYPKGGATPLIAPHSVYATADQMADAKTSDPNFNLTWVMSVDPSFNYLIRLHFCDIASKGLNELYFNVYLNGIVAVSGLDLSTITSGLAIPYYKDFVLNASTISNGTVVIQVGPSSNIMATMPNAILNGLEVMKISNSAGSLDGLFSSHGAESGQSYVTSKVAAGIGLTLGATALILLFVGILRWHKRPNKGYEKQKTFSSWLLPLNTSQCSFLSSKTKSTTFSNILNSGVNLGRYFTLNEIREATKNFDDKAVVGVGGFGKVYLGEIEDGTKLAIKRGNPSSSQGINEFQTEIQLLSKLRHRHLVSLIGYCDEQSEMILVYEYMAYGPLRDHLYGSSLPHLSWRQRLEICIGSARGLHYLHTGSTQGIIHRDVKTTNILLDENFEAKVSDFGLSKVGPASLDQTHVSTAVKGSFGYLDPEYFRRQQLTEKSDVYSFGVVLFEVLCARPALDPALPRDQVNLAEWAKGKNAKGEIRKIVDPIITGTISQESLMKYVEAAEKCLAEYGVDRPSMGDVLWHLEYALQLQETASGSDNDRTVEDFNGVKMVTNGNEASKSKETKDEMVNVDMSDDSGVVVGSPMFLENFQGR